MKSLSKLTLSFSILCMIICLQAQGQTYYNFIMGYTSPAPNPSYSIVRTVDAQRAVAYYEEGNTHKLAVIDMYGHIAEVALRDVDINMGCRFN